MLARAPSDHSLPQFQWSRLPISSPAARARIVEQLECVSQIRGSHISRFHVDAHRSTALVVSKYSPGSAGRPYVAHDFYTTASMVRTMENLIGLPPMNNNDAQAPLMAPLFSGAGNQPPFSADYRNRDNNLIYRMNSSVAPGAKESARMDFTHADQANTAVLNRILWRDRMGNTPEPVPRHVVIP